MKPVSFNGRTRSGFTLLELLASMAILALMVTMLFAAFGQASRAWLASENRVETFTQARAALDLMARELSQTVVTSNITFLADANDLAFVAPVNQGTNAVDIMEVVYRLSAVRASGAGLPDPGNVFVDAPNTWPKRLVRRTSHFGAPPGEGWDYGQGAPCTIIPPWDFYGAAGSPNINWPETSAYSQTAVLAENVMGLRFRFFDSSGSLAQSYWNSNVTLPFASWSHELQTSIPAGTVGPAGPGGVPVMTNRSPAGVEITLYVIDSKAAARLQGLGPLTPGFMSITNQAMKSFFTFVAIPNRQP